MNKGSQRSLSISRVLKVNDQSVSQVLSTRTAREIRQLLNNNPELWRTKIECLQKKINEQKQQKSLLQQTLQSLVEFNQQARRQVQTTCQVPQSRKMVLKVHPALMASQKVKFQMKDLLREASNNYTLWSIEMRKAHQTYKQSMTSVRRLLQQSKTFQDELLQYRAKKQQTYSESRVQNTTQKLKGDQVEHILKSQLDQLDRLCAQIKGSSERISQQKQQQNTIKKETTLFTEQLRLLHDTKEQERIKLKLHLVKQSNDILQMHIHKAARHYNSMGGVQLTTPRKRSLSKSQQSTMTHRSRSRDLSRNQFFVTPRKLIF